MQLELVRYNKQWIEHELRELIDEIINNPISLERVAGSSVQHDNGFLKVVVKDRHENDFGLRIHKWKEGMSDSNIHTHRWDMISLILAGGYNANEYLEAVKGISYNCYDFTSLTNNYTLTANGIVQLAEMPTKEYKQGDCYEMNKGQIHRVSRVNNDGALTAVLSWGEELAFAKVYSLGSLNEKKSNQRGLSPEEVKVVLEEVMSCIR